MQKQGLPKDTKELSQMSQEGFLEKFYDGKINYKLPSKYPENFTLCKSYNDGKKEIPLTHRDKVGVILKDAFNCVKPLVKKFKLSLALLIESNVTYKGVAWTKRIKIDFSMPAVGGKKEELFAYTSMIQIKIRNKDHPQNPKLFLNKTTILAILLHELAHTRHMNHGIEFALFLKEMFEYAMTIGIFPENEEHMIPSSRDWERRMFETKGSMTKEELEAFFAANPANAENMDDEHGENLEQEEANTLNDLKSSEESKIEEERSENAQKKTATTGKVDQKKNIVGSKDNQTAKKGVIGAKIPVSKTINTPKEPKMGVEGIKEKKNVREGLKSQGNKIINLSHGRNEVEAIGKRKHLENKKAGGNEGGDKEINEEVKEEKMESQIKDTNRMEIE